MCRARSSSIRRGGFRAFRAAAVALALTLPGAGLATSVSSASAAEGEDNAGPAPTLVAAPKTPVFDSGENEIRIDVLLRNPGDEPLEGGEIVLHIDNARAENDGDLAPATPRESQELSRVEAQEVAAHADQLIEVTVQRADVPLEATRQPGVYPIEVEFVPASANEAESPEEATDEATGDEASPTVLARTSIVWGGVDAPAALPLTLVVPLVLPDDITTLPTAEQLATQAPRLTELLTSAERRGATLAVDPRIIAGIRALGTTAPGVATTLLDRLTNTVQPIFLLQYADADPAAQAALGFDSLLKPVGLSYAINPSALPLEVDSGEGEADQITDEDPSAIEMRALTHLPNAQPGAWPAGGEADSATLALLTKAGLTSLVLDSSNVTNATGNRVTLGSFQALVADTTLATASSTTLAAATATEREAGAAALAARTGIAAQSSSTGLVLALDRGAVAASTDPQSLFDTLDTFRWMQTVPAAAQPEGTATLRAGATLESRRELLRTTIARSSQIDGLAPLLQHPEYLTQYQRERLLEAFATRYASSAEAMAAAEDRRQERDNQLLLGVRPITSEHTQLVGTSSRVPITLSNSLPFDAAVSLWATPTSAAIAISERSVDAIVPASGNAIVLIPVHSRVSSGESGINLELRDADGEQSFAIGMQHLVLRTTVETIMLVALGSAAALLLGFGIWRSVRSRRTKAAGNTPGLESLQIHEGEPGDPTARIKE